MSQICSEPLIWNCGSCGHSFQYDEWILQGKQCPACAGTKGRWKCSLCNEPFSQPNLQACHPCKKEIAKELQDQKETEAFELQAVLIPPPNKELSQIQVAPPVLIRTEPNKSYHFLKPYYQKVFARFDQVEGVRTAKWNWAAFIFGPLWALEKGLIRCALLLFVITALILVPVLGLIINLVAHFYLGRNGNWIYYKKITGNKDLWV